MKFDKEKGEMIISTLNNAEKEMARPYSKERIRVARACFEAGFAENILDSPIVQNAMNLLAPFIKNSKIKKAIRLMQEGLEDERKRAKQEALGKPWK